MNWNEYLGKCEETLDDKCKNPDYIAFGLTSEFGEVEGVWKKYLRKDFDFDTLRSRMLSEIGDVLWYSVISLKYCFAVPDFTEVMEVVNPVFDNHKMPVSDSWMNKKLIVIRRLTSIANEYIINGQNHGSIIISLIHELSELVNLDDAKEQNISKLAERKLTGTIRGDGESVNERKVRNKNSKTPKGLVGIEG